MVGTSIDSEESDESIILKIGNFCFRYRAISVVPVILIIYMFFSPGDPGRLNTLVNFIGFIIALSGGLIRMTSVGFSKPVTSGRQNYLKAENLNTSGLYSLVRNPLYVGSFFIYNGVLIAYSSIFALIFLNIFFLINYYFIIYSEENYLKGEFGEEYKKYINSVPKAVPNFRNYKKNEGKFNLFKVILREKNTTFYWVVFYIISLLIKQYKLNDGVIDHFWWYAVPVIIFFILNLMLTLYKKYVASEKDYT